MPGLKRSKMTVEEILSALGAKLVAGKGALKAEVVGGYASDLLSCVMAGASPGDVWVTLQAHVNVIAVAELLDLSCVIITEGAQPDRETLAKANDKNVPVLLSPESTFAVVSRLAQLGIQASQKRSEPSRGD